VKDEAESDQGQSNQHRVDDHCLHVELQRFLGLCADADHTDADQFHDLATGNGVEHGEASQQIQYELRDTVVCRYRQVHHYLDDEKDVDAASEVVVHLLLFPCFLKCHIRLN